MKTTLAIAAVFAAGLYAAPALAQADAPAPEATGPSTGDSDANTAPAPKKHPARHHHKTAAAKPDMAMPDSSKVTPSQTQPK